MVKPDEGEYNMGPSIFSRFKGLSDTKRLVYQGRAQIVLLALILAAVLWDGGFDDASDAGAVGAMAAAALYALKSVLPGQSE